jgi:restriction endonuclease S subunit
MKMVKLKDVCRLVGGGTPAKANSSFYLGDIPWATVRDLRSRWLVETEHEINAFAVKESSTNVIPAGNVVLATRVGLGKVVQLLQDTAINQDLRGLIPRENSTIDSNYLYYWALSITPEIIAAGKGATVQGITLPFLENLVIPLPSLEKQRMIVEKLDSAFADIDLLEGNLGLGAEKANQLSQSLLNMAFNPIKNSDDPRNPLADLGVGLQMTSLRDLCTVFTDGDWVESKDQSDIGIRLIQTGNVGQGIFKDRIDKARWISEETFRRLRCTEIGEGDVLISRLPDPVGRACLIPALEHKAITAVDCSIVRFDRNKIHPRFFVYYSQSSSYESAIRPLVSGSTRQRISREKLGTIQIPLLSMERQLEVLAKLDIAFAEIELWKVRIKVEKDYAVALRQSLLSSIFSKEKAVA